jgi:hypothetical protein
VDWTATRYVVLAEKIPGFLTASSNTRNMLALPRELEMEIDGFVEVKDADVAAHALMSLGG